MLAITATCDLDHRRRATAQRFCEQFFKSANLEKPALLRAVAKLAIAGEQAGFSLEQMIDLLNAGLSVETLLDLIAWRFEASRNATAPISCSSGWIM
jgi:hypothetical protein